MQKFSFNFKMQMKADAELKKLTKYFAFLVSFLLLFFVFYFLLTSYQGYI